MKPILRLVIVLLLLAGFQNPTWGWPAGRLPFKQDGEHIVISATLGGTKTLRFAVDIGTTYSMIDSRIASEYGLTKGEAVSVSVIGRHVEVYETRVPRICFGKTCIDAVEARICDLSNFKDLDGLLGLDLFRKAGLTLDFSEKYLEFRPADHLASRQRFVGALAFVPIRAQCGDQTLVLMLDSAGIDLILFEERIKNLVKVKRTGTNRTVQGAGASFTIEEVTLPNLSVGHLKLKDYLGFLWTEPTHRRIHGIVGVAGLGLRQLSLDFENNLISWE